MEREQERKENNRGTSRDERDWQERLRGTSRDLGRLAGETEGD